MLAHKIFQVKFIAGSVIRGRVAEVHCISQKQGDLLAVFRVHESDADVRFHGPTIQAGVENPAVVVGTYGGINVEQAQYMKIFRMPAQDQGSQD